MVFRVAQSWSTVGRVAGAIEVIVFVVAMVTQHQVEQSGLRTMAPSSPVYQSVSPETPKFWSARSDLEPMMTDEEEVV